MAPSDATRARRWFWTLTATAVFSTGRLYDGLRAAPGPATGLLVLGSALLLVGSLVQAARILARLGRGQGGDPLRRE